MVAYFVTQRSSARGFRVSYELKEHLLKHTVPLDSKVKYEKADTLLNLCFFSPILAALLPIPFNMMELRLCTAVTTLLILCTECERVTVLANKVTAHFADISYALYLAHLPVYFIVEFYSDYIYWPFPLGMLISFMLATIMQRYVESTYRALPQSANLALSLVLFTVAATLYW
ncbi:hypothetical protein Y032_0620g734 [Ancylostoma ceylanicum]|uniref:Acyltransferase 3 domain-containing protein n=2 Tax=Ancylostoma ceylanicum TaxID=53326 RepID=A0A016WKW6_9BILA|nr:hypothetical protein Y032_0620g734 [Ancylostoma ceylanicum]